MRAHSDYLFSPMLTNLLKRGQFVRTVTKNKWREYLTKRKSRSSERKNVKRIIFPPYPLRGVSDSEPPSFETSGSGEELNEDILKENVSARSIIQVDPNFFIGLALPAASGDSIYHTFIQPPPCEIFIQTCAPDYQSLSKILSEEKKFELDLQ